MNPVVGTQTTMLVGRYALFDRLAQGGMASVYLGRQLDEAGLGRLVAIKRLHPHLAAERDFVTMLLDEARIAARIRHPNVVSVLDVATIDEELLLVMDYIHGIPLSRWPGTRTPGSPLPLGISSAIALDVLQGLHAAHAARDAAGDLLGVVHRDVSPQNIIVGADGLARLVDFGIARARGRLGTTRDPTIKGKIRYMAPEQLRTQPVTGSCDLYATAVVLWECLTGRPLVMAEDETGIEQILLGDFDPPSRWRKELGPSVDDLVMRGLARNAAERYASARDFAVALERQLPHASRLELSNWVESQFAESLLERAELVRKVESFDGDELRRTLWSASGLPGGPTRQRASSVPRDPVAEREPRGVELRHADDELDSLSDRPFTMAGMAATGRRRKFGVVATGLVAAGIAAGWLIQGKVSSPSAHRVTATPVHIETATPLVRALEPAAAPPASAQALLADNATKDSTPRRDVATANRPTNKTASKPRPSAQCEWQRSPGPDGHTRYQQICQ